MRMREWAKKEGLRERKKGAGKIKKQGREGHKRRREEERKTERRKGRWGCGGGSGIERETVVGGLG